VRRDSLELLDLSNLAWLFPWLWPLVIGMALGARRWVATTAVAHQTAGT
jgi:hypothetical protein